MRVLITGASSRFGATLVQTLLGDPEVEHVLALGDDRDEQPLADRRLTYRTVDLTHERAIHDLLWGPARELRIDRIVHGIQDVPMTRRLLRGCLEHPTIHRFVYRSFAEVYELSHASSNLIDEEAPLDLSPRNPPWIRRGVEADLDVCAHQGGHLGVTVLRFADIFSPGTDSQLWDYMQSATCLRPAGFDPMINVLSLDDAASAVSLALRADATGVFNIRGADTLPLSCAIEECGRIDLPVPNALISPLYRLRAAVTGSSFHYARNFRRFHFGGLLDGTRARRVLGYEPRIPVEWSQRWWFKLATRLASDRIESARPMLDRDLSR